jgi:hypothetical protein
MTRSPSYGPGPPTCTPTDVARSATRAESQADRDEQDFQDLSGPVEAGTADAAQRDRYARVSLRMRRRPARTRLMPTHVGNVLRAAETRPLDKDGLDAVAVWPHLWLLLPDTVRAELSVARRSLDGAVAAAVWGVLFLAFVSLTWWALPVALAVAGGAVLFWVPARTYVFAGLLEAAFDLYRTAIYTQLRWPLPTNPADERAAGRRITTYLVRGLSGTSPTFTRDHEDAAPAGPQTPPTT